MSSPFEDYIKNKSLRLESIMDSHIIGECFIDCPLCIAEMIHEYVRSWDFDNLLEEHEQKHKRSWLYPYWLRESCEYCQMDYILIESLKELKEHQ